jgi:dihydroxyacetone kinase-like protein
MFSVVNLVKALDLFKEKIDKNKDYLSELDTPIGDGDHGNNMVRGMAAVKESLDSKQPETVQDVFKLTAMALISKVEELPGRFMEQRCWRWPRPVLQPIRLCRY